MSKVDREELEEIREQRPKSANRAQPQYCLICKSKDVTRVFKDKWAVLDHIARKHPESMAPEELAKWQKRIKSKDKQDWYCSECDSKINAKSKYKHPCYIKRQ